jgi:hypothetical protein
MYQNLPKDPEVQCTDILNTKTHEVHNWIEKLDLSSVKSTVQELYTVQHNTLNVNTL